MKKKILVLITLFLALVATFCFSAFAVSAEETEPRATIAKFNLAFEDNTYLKYAVRFDGVDDADITENSIGMLYWTDYADGFVPGTEDYSSATMGYITIDGVKHYVFEYDKLAAKQLTDYVYSIAYIELDGEIYYSEPVKYSALEYAYNRLGKTSEGTTNEELKTLLNNMLAYGASAQQYFDYKEDRLATADFCQITLVGGTLDDGFTSGLYLSTDEVTITAPETDGDMAFDSWTNNLDETVSTDKSLIVRNLTANVTYTANYKTKVEYSEGLEYTSNGDGTCYVSGIGECGDTEIVIPKTSPAGDRVTGIGDSAFQGCNSLTSIEIPDSVTSVGRLAFASCWSLTSIKLPDGLTSIGDRAFWGCDSLTTVEIPKGVTSIEEWTFYGCDSLKSVVLPDGLISIGAIAFNSCTALDEVLIPDSVTSIGDTAFVCCSSLTNISISENLINIGTAAFRGCTSLKAITVDKDNPNYKAIDGNLYTKDGEIILAYAAGKTDSSFVIPNHVTNIGDSAFWGSSSLESIVIPDSVTSIGNCAFRHCIALPSIDIPDGVTSIGESAFEYCTSLTSIVLPEGVVNMGDRAFDGCTALESVEILNGLTSISYAAFNDCTALKSIMIPDSVTSIGNYAFDGCTSLIFNEYDNALYLGNEGNPYLALIKAKDTQITSCNIHKDTKIIDGGSGLSHCSSLTGIVIPEGVTSIGDDAFSSCSSLTSVVIPDSVTSIDSHAFSSCSSLTSVVIPDSVTSIGFSAFLYCRSLTSVVIPDSVTSIGECAFYDCNSLTDVYYTGSESDWAHITIDSYNDSLKNATRYYYSTTEPITEGKFWHFVEGVPTAWPEYCLPTYSEGLAFTSNGDGTCYVSGIGECEDVDVVVPPVSPNGEMVTGIGGKAFYDCISIKSIAIPDSVTSIAERAFFNCSALTSIEIPEGVTDIGDWAFGMCYRLREVINKSSLDIVKGAETYGSIAYYAYEVHSGESKIANVNDCLFYSVGGVNYLVSYVGDDTELVLPGEYNGGNYNIGNFAFLNCSSFESVVISEGVTSIGAFAFNNCISLNSIVIPSSATNIGERIFVGSSNLSTVHYNTDYYNSSNNIFDLPHITEVTFGGSFVPAKVLSDCEAIRNITVLDSVTHIGLGAFEGCTALESLTLPFVGEYKDGTGKTHFMHVFGVYYAEALYDDIIKKIPSLKNVVITGGDTIADSAFRCCATIENVTLPNGITTIGERAFQACSNLKRIKIPEGVTAIEYAAFEDTALENVVIPDSVTNIGDYAFYNCTLLVDVYYTGSESEWADITVGLRNDCLTNGTIHYNYVPSEE